MTDLPGDPTLPPGCTLADIERRFDSGWRVCRFCGRAYLVHEGSEEECGHCIEAETLERNENNEH
jgi:hypothetical protein